MSNEDAPTESYKYMWTADSELSLQDFLAKYKPSMVENDGTKPWIWVRGKTPSKLNTGIDAATKEAKDLLKEVTEKVESIKNDDSIPVRSNKKTGAKCKKEVREKVQEEATEQLKEIAQRHGYVSGKWLIFAPAEKIDVIWSNIATSLVSGPLQSTAAHLTKVATSSQDKNPNAQHLICVYMPDVYDKGSVTEVMKILLRNHGVNLSGVKADLYTAIGLDSKHGSGTPSTIWKNNAILSEKDAKELKDAFFADLAAKKSEPAPKVTKSELASGEGSTEGKVEPEPALKKAKAKPRLKKKVDDPFASDDDTKAEEPKKASNSGTTKRSQNTEDEEEDERPKKKRTVKK